MSEFEGSTWKRSALVDETNGKLREAFLFARRTGKVDSLLDQLKFLRRMKCGNQECQVVLTTDFAPYSFMWYHQTRTEPGAPWRQWYFGGLIFHGPHDRGGDGGAPTYCVNLGDSDGWSLHS